MEKVRLMKNLAATINVLAWIYLVVIAVLCIWAIVEELLPALTISLIISGLVGFVILLAFGKAIELLIEIRNSQLISHMDMVVIKTINKRDTQIREEQNVPQEKEMEAIEITTENLHILNSLIHKQKRKLWGISQKSDITTLISSLAASKETAEKLNLEYKNLFDKYLIEDLKEISSNYDTIRDYLKAFIEHNIVSEIYPHDKLTN